MCQLTSESGDLNYSGFCMFVLVFVFFVGERGGNVTPEVFRYLAKCPTVVNLGWIMDNLRQVMILNDKCVHLNREVCQKLRWDGNLKEFSLKKHDSTEYIRI